jgi:polysaccharide pyruvyl transferase WcaK-like protein
MRRKEVQKTEEKNSVILDLRNEDQAEEKKKIKFLFTGLLYLNHNYGAQGIAFPMMEKLSRHFDAEYTFVLSQKCHEETCSFSAKYDFKVITASNPFVIFKKRYFPIYLLYRLIKRKTVLQEHKRRYLILVDALSENDVVIDLSGIQFIGNIPLKRRYLNYLARISLQLLAEKYGKLYLKYTKSYGPFPSTDKLYKFLVKRQLSKLPFLFVRGEGNLDEIKKLNLKIPLYSFPDISLSLEAESRNWALNYLDELGVDTSKKVVGVSPSTVIASIRTKNIHSSCGDNHLKLCKEIIKFYRLNNQQVLLIPHSINDGKDLRSCDLALARKIYDETRNKKGLFLVDNTDLTYKQVRAIIGLLDFYVTSRYHSLSSALFMAVPTVALSWHIKYNDINSLFFDESPIIWCREENVEKSMAQIKDYYYNRQWFKRAKLLEKKKEIIAEIDKSITIIVDEINRKLGKNEAGDETAEIWMKTSETYVSQ